MLIYVFPNNLPVLLPLRNILQHKNTYIGKHLPLSNLDINPYSLLDHFYLFFGGRGGGGQLFARSDRDNVLTSQYSKQQIQIRHFLVVRGAWRILLGFSRLCFQTSF